MDSFYVVRLFLNQVRAALRPARAWFFKIVFVRDVSMCVCPPAPKAINYGDHFLKVCICICVCVVLCVCVCVCVCVHAHNSIVI